MMKISNNLFDKVGFCNFEGYEKEMNRWQKWLSLGNAADLKYMQQRKHPSELLDNAQSAVVCLLNYYLPEVGPIARYARGKDYHYIMWEKLHTLAHELGLHENEYLACCDTMPILERVLAVKAGLGWLGRNNCLITRDMGSFCFIGVLLTTLTCDNPIEVKNGCGKCHKCIESCPTGALSNHSLDCRKCLSYRTIESKEPLTDNEARHGMVFGCDRCQEVCPWNIRFAKRHNHLELCSASISIPELTHSKIKGTALSRAPLSKIKQNYSLCISNHQNS